MPRRAPLAALAALVLAAAPVLFVGSTAAFAAYTPDGEATLTVATQYYAEQDQNVDGYCQDDTLSVNLVSDPVAGVTWDPIVYNADPGDPGRFTTYYRTDDSIIAPGTMVFFTAQCLGAGGVVLAEAFDWVISYDPANDTVAPPNVVVDGDITVSGVCPDDAGVADISAWVDGSNAEIVDGVEIASTPAWSYTFSSVTVPGDPPAVVGDVIRVAVLCIGVEDDLLTNRHSLVEVVAAPEELGTLSAPAGVPSGATLTVTGTCPSDTEILEVSAMIVSTGGLAATGQLPQGAGAWSVAFEPSDFPSVPAAGDQITLVAYCESGDDNLSVLSAVVAVTAAELGDTGVSAAPYLVAAGLLVGAGVLLLLVRARRREA